MNEWTIAAVQMDCQLKQPTANLTAVRERLKQAANAGARLVVFPECALSGYGFASRAEAIAIADTLPGQATEALAQDCAKLDVFAVVGLLERDHTGKVFNSSALVGPKGFIAGYRKIHLPCIGADRFVDPGDRSYSIHDLGGLRLGLSICFDMSFPESARVLTLLGADVIALPTNWATPSVKMAELVCRVRALENCVYFVCVNRVGDETGFHYIGKSSIVNCAGDYIAQADHDGEAIVTARIDPAAARQKKVVYCAGEFEIDRVGWRRPEMYGRLLEQ
jgi:predicted amidohydrolase